MEITSSPSSISDDKAVWNDLSRPLSSGNVSPFAFPRPTDDVVKNAKILIVDDELAVIQLVSTYLHQAGFRACESVCDSSLALLQILETEPDVVLLDIQMRPVGGLEILELMKRDERTQHIPVIVLTSATDEDTKITALNLGANDFLTKPVALSELLARVRNTLSAKAFHDQVTAQNLRLESDAFSDPLTGIANRRAFGYELKRRVTDMKQDGVPLGLLMFDIDHFKSFNDRCGHRIGDAVLSNVAQEACRCVRETDLVARYGGEEFAVILPAAALPKAKEVAERLLSSIEKKQHIFEGQALRVTVSVGVATAVKGDDADSLVRKADDALYSAKHNGRNVAYFHDGEKCLPVKAVDPAELDKNSYRVWHDVSPIECSRIAIVDDEPAIVALTQKYLSDAGFKNFLPITNAKEAVGKIKSESPDLVLLDIHMPEVDGISILKSLRTCGPSQRIPILVFTSAKDEATKVKALSLAANDFLEKPVRPGELTARVRNTLLAKSYVDRLANYSQELERQVKERTVEVFESRKRALHCLARAAELRDDQTGQHVLRVGRYAALIAEELGFSAERVDWIEHAAQLHDVGKIGISDNILLKPGSLSRQEYEVVKSHCLMGFNVLQDDENYRRTLQEQPQDDPSQDFPPTIMALAASVAATHHEKWDGTGYPRGLAGKEIPIEGRITAVADVFDALSTERTYKDAIPLEKCFVVMEQNRGAHFDPDVLDAFFRRKSEVKRAFHLFNGPWGDCRKPNDCEPIAEVI